MIEKLQIKFVGIIMAIMTIVMLCIFTAINITMYRSTEMQTFGMMQKIAESDGQMRGIGKPDTHNDKPLDDKLLNDKPSMIPQTNFSVKLDNDGKIIGVISDRNQNYTEEEIASYLSSAMDSQADHGSIGELKFLVEQKSYGQIVVFLDNSMQMNSTVRLLWITLVVGLAGWIVILFVSLYLSNWAIKPVKKAYEAQKQFVADASHELKTPLTVISANVDVLSSDIADNKWLGFIKAETVRMSGLINNLLYLAKSDVSESKYVMSKFGLSDAVVSAALPFESICYESRKNLTLEIKEGIICEGDENRLVQVIIILMDNAVKNASDNGEIVVSLSEKNGKKFVSVYNTGDGLSEEEKVKVFDRFYRGDGSRDRETGGYGLGLSIAKSIVETHKGKLTIESEKGKWVKFTMILQ